MGIFSTIGKIVGSVVGGPVGGTIGGAVGKVGDKAIGGKKSSDAGSQTYIQPPRTSLEDLRSSRTAAKSSMPSASDVKVAKSADTPNIPGSNFLLDDPWKPTRDWYEALGGDPEVAKTINKDRMPF
jgi:hypothetical protein